MSIRQDGVLEQLQLRVCIFSLGLILVLSLYRLLLNSSQVDNEVLEALLTVINPTRSFWPADVMKVAASVRENKIIKISLRQLYLHLLSGALEFRNPSVDLVQILKEGEYHINGWRVQITVDASWWTSISIWILSSFTGIMKPRNLLEQGRRRKSFTFDGLPLSQVENFACDLRSQVPRSSVILEFTTRTQSSVALRSSTFILCCLPFLARKRSPTPIFLSLHRVINLLSSGNEEISVDVIQNTSEQYAALLEKRVGDLEQDLKVRAEVIERNGLEEWRKEKLCTSLEAALIRAGILARWKVHARRL